MSTNRRDELIKVIHAAQYNSQGLVIRDDQRVADAVIAWIDRAGVVAEEPEPMKLVDERDPECVKAWPECHTFGYDPACCRFPKSCSAGEVHTVPVKQEGADDAQ